MPRAKPAPQQRYAAAAADVYLSSSDSDTPRRKRKPAPRRRASAPAPLTHASHLKWVSPAPTDTDLVDLFVCSVNEALFLGMDVALPPLPAPLAGNLKTTLVGLAPPTHASVYEALPVAAQVPRSLHYTDWTVWVWVPTGGFGTGREDSGAAAAAAAPDSAAAPSDVVILDDDDEDEDIPLSGSRSVATVPTAAPALEAPSSAAGQWKLAPLPACLRCSDDFAAALGLLAVNGFLVCTWEVPGHSGIPLALRVSLRRSAFSYGAVGSEGAATKPLQKAVAALLKSPRVIHRAEDASLYFTDSACEVEAEELIPAPRAFADEVAYWTWCHDRWVEHAKGLAGVEGEAVGSESRTASSSTVAAAAAAALAEDDGGAASSSSTAPASSSSSVPTVAASLSSPWQEALSKLQAAADEAETAAAGSHPLTEADVYAAARPHPHEADGRPPQAALEADPAFGRIAEALLPTLRPYQARDVAWMLRREAVAESVLLEGVHGSGSTASPVSAAQWDAESVRDLHPLWFKARSINGVVFYGTAYSGLVSLDPVPHLPPPPPPEGVGAAAGGAAHSHPTPCGILASEMGTGKTICTLALVAATDAPATDAVFAAQGPYAGVSVSRLHRRIAVAVEGPKPRPAPPPRPVLAAGDGEGGDELFEDNEGDAVAVARAAAAAAAGDDLVSGPLHPEGPWAGTPQIKSRLLDAPGLAPPYSDTIACVCQLPFLEALPQDVQAAMQNGATGLMKEVRGPDGKKTKIWAPIERKRADALDWVQCHCCQRWQHAVCAGLMPFQPPSAPVVCVECQVSLLAGQPLNTAATAVVCPAHIVAQWQSEIARHVRKPVDPAAAGAAAAAAAAAAMEDAGVAVASSSSSSSVKSGELRVIFYKGVKATLTAMRQSVAKLSIETAALKAFEPRRAALAALKVALEPDGDEAGSERPAAAAAAQPPPPVAIAAASDASASSSDDDDDDAVFAAPAMEPAPQPAAVAVSAYSGRRIKKRVLQDTISDDGDEEEQASSRLAGTKHRRSDFEGASAAAAGGAGGQAGGGAVLPLVQAVLALPRPRGASTVTLASLQDLSFVKRELSIAETRVSELTASVEALASEVVSNANSLSVLTLANADIVVTSYNALTDDIHHAAPTMSAAAVSTPLAGRLAALFGPAPDLPKVDEALAIALRYFYLGDDTRLKALLAGGSVGGDGDRRRGGGGGMALPEFAAAAAGSTRRAKELTRGKLPPDAAAAAAAAAAAGEAAASGAMLRGRFKSSDPRVARKYRIIPSPMTCVRFWRLALDEAQAIDSPVSKAAEMVRQVPSVHNWAISGTPLKGGTADLQGLLTFLDWKPWSYPDVFKKCLLDPAERGEPRARAALVRLISRVMWRSRVADVEAELALPPVTEEVVPLTFSRIEEAFYRRAFSGVLEALERHLTEWDADQRREGASSLRQQLTGRESTAILHPLLALRQACVHPQIGAAGLRRSMRSSGRGAAARRRREDAEAHDGAAAGGHVLGGGGFPVDGVPGAMMTLDDVLSKMITDAIADCEDSQRAVMMTLNGLAGLYILSGDHQAAAAHYKSVLSAAAAAADVLEDSAAAAAFAAQRGLPLDLARRAVVRVDKQQRLHACHHLLYLEDARVEQLADAGGAAVAAAKDDDDAEALVTPAPPLPPAEVAALTALAGKIESEFLSDSATQVALHITELEETVASLLEEVQLALTPCRPGEALVVSDALAAAAHDARIPRQPLPAIEPSATRMGVAVHPRRVATLIAAMGALNAVGKAALIKAAQEAVSLCVRRSTDMQALLQNAALGSGVCTESEIRDATRGQVLYGSEAVVPPLSWRVISAASLVDLVSTGLQAVFSAREGVYAAVMRCLCPTPEDLARASNCGVCHGGDWGRTGPPCTLCEGLKKLAAYRRQLLVARVRQIAADRNRSSEVRAAPELLLLGGRQRRRAAVAASIGIADAVGASAAGGGGALESWLARQEDDDEQQLAQSLEVDSALVRVIDVAVTLGELPPLDIGASVSRDALAAAKRATPASLLRVCPGLERRVADGALPADSGVAVVAAAGADASVVEPRALLAALRGLQEEQGALRELLLSQQQLMFSLEELKMCLTRVELVPRSEEADVPDDDQVRVKRRTIPWRLAELRGQLATAGAVFARKQAHLKFFLNIARQEREDDNRECAICFGPLGGVDGEVIVFRTCGHRLCARCLDSMVAARRYGGLVCHVCRKPFDPDTDTILTTVNGGGGGAAAAAAAAVAPESPCEAGSVSPASAVAPVTTAAAVAAATRQQAARRLAEAEAAAVGDALLTQRQNDSPGMLAPFFTTGVSGAEAALGQVVGSWGTKVTAIVRCIKGLCGGPLSAPPGERPNQCLIFSQWDAALLIVEAALKANGVSCLRATGGGRAASAVVQSFIDDSSVAALLMPFSRGAEGLNLVNANHVFLLEPLMAPALEQQAIGRVRRIGQTRPSYVHRLLISESIEEPIAKLSAAKLRRKALLTQQRAVAAAAHWSPTSGGGAAAGGPPRLPGAAAQAVAFSGAPTAGNEAFLASLLAAHLARREAALTPSNGSGGAAAAASSSSSSSDDEEGEAAVAADVFGVAGSDNVGLTRRDIFKLVERERAHQARILAEGAEGEQGGSSVASNSGAVAASAAVAQPAPLVIDEVSSSEDEDNNEPMAPPAPPPPPPPPAQPAESVGDMAARAASNQYFWAGERVLRSSSSGGVPTVRLALLQETQRTTAAGAPPGPPVSIFGRDVPLPLALQLLQLQALPAPQPLAARAAAVQSEAATLLASLSQEQAL